MLHLISYAGRIGLPHGMWPGPSSAAIALLILALAAPAPSPAAPDEAPAEATAEATAVEKKKSGFRFFRRNHKGADPVDPEKAPKQTSSEKTKAKPTPEPQPKATPKEKANPKPAPAPAETGDIEKKKKSWFRFRNRPGDDGGVAASKDRARTGSLFGSARRQAPAPSPEDIATTVRVQIFLDESHFGPGKIDGSPGGFTQQAVRNFNRARGVAPENWYYVLRESSRSLRNIHRPYTIRSEDWKHVGALPYDPPSQAERSYMPYRSMHELVAERFHTSENYLKSINPETNLYRLKTGSELIVPNVTPFRIEDVRSNERFPEDATLSSHHLIVDTKQKFAFILQSKQDEMSLLAAFPITPGAERYIPYGNWRIDTMVTTPTFRYDKQMLAEGVRGEEFFMIPPGPNSPVGIFWAGLNKSGIGLHGTNNPGTIGRARSAGCIRLANWDAIRLSKFVRPGTTVEVR